MVLKPEASHHLVGSKHTLSNHEKLDTKETLKLVLGGGVFME
jgi:hypothetical protein